ncbi:MAG TPA: carboxypeptidase-like regulatory domain-containing protein [Pyrinomonadaceae bacterium]|nr:carboxypeptidase-like regulatory domain-containing protein [Pyrinomonadaceae bacterium]
MFQAPFVRRAPYLLGALLLSLLTFGSAFAQTGTASVRGTVADPQGSAVAGATVTLRNDEKNFSRTQTTNEDGGYTFTLVPPDTYRLEVEATGFKKTEISNVVAQVDTPLDVNVTMEVGGITETVQITSANEATLNTTDATIGTTFESRRISELPLNARNVIGLLSLQPGVTRAGEVNGTRRDQSNILLDGIDNNEQQSGLDVVSSLTTQVPGYAGDAFGSVLRVTPDSVQEFRVTTTNPNADQGRSSGAQVSLVTKSGTNEFHGSVYEYHRNTVTTANDYFNNAIGRYTQGVAADEDIVNAGQANFGDLKAPRPKLIRNIFGGSLGGPIIKNRFYFFYNYEGRRDAEAQSVLAPVPTASLRQGNVRYRCDLDHPDAALRANCQANGGIITLTPANIAALYPATGGVNPAGLSLLQTAPLPNDFTTGDGLNTAGFRFNAPISSELNVHIARFDLTLTDRQSVYLRANYQDDLYGQAPAFPTTPSPDIWVHPIGFVVGHNWTLTNTLVNSFRVGLTRQSFSRQGDSNENLVNFRFVYQPFLYQRGLSRTTPVWNVADDISWIKGTHTIQFGGNLRFVRNNRVSFANAFDTAIINPSYYDSNGSSLSEPLDDLASGSIFSTRSAVAAVLGRFSQYAYNVTYDKQGNVLPAGSPSDRTFATEEYEFYGQDIWKIRPNLTLTYGLRYGVSTPVYETEGFQTSPTVSLSDFFRRRQEGAAAGTPLNELITVDLSGRANGRPDFYKTDWNNFAPNISVAWSPDFGDNFFGRLFGRDGRSVLRGGFRMIYDRLGSGLAVGFDLNNALGFSANNTISPNRINTTTRLGPLFTGLGQDIRNSPFLTVPGPIQFPLSEPADNGLRIQQTIDDSLTTPRQYSFNLTYGRELPKGFSFEASYIGRLGRNLLVERDTMQFNNLRDPQSGTTWYEAAGILADWRFHNVPVANITPIPYFENLFPNAGADLFGDPGMSATEALYTLHARPDLGGFDFYDFTNIQTILDNFTTSSVGPNPFEHPQYGTLSTLSSVGSSDYHGATFTLRQRFRDDVFVDVNYTFAKALDNGSPIEADAQLGGNLTRNSFDLNLTKSFADFDVRHNLNANWLVALPFGKGKRFASGMPKVLDGILGGWQLTGIFRWHSGLPAGTPGDVGFWNTNWQITNYGVRLRNAQTCQSDVDGSPNLFCNPVDAYQSFRNSRAGEVGDRNVFRLPSYIVLDSGLSKTFKMWYSENHRLQFRWEVFNVTNTQRFGTLSNFSLNQEPQLGEPDPDFGRYVGSQTPIGENRPGRVMQFALRYTF